MAFVSKNFVKVQGFASDENAQPNLFKYNSLSDTQATVEAAGYLDDVYLQLAVNDLIYLVMEDGAATGLYQVASIVAGVVTISGFATIGAGGVGTTQLANLAVTTAKIAALAVDNSKLAVSVPRTATVSLSAANFNGMYAAPVELVAAGGANTLHIVQSVVFEVDYGTTQFASGGAVAVQYDNTANGAGTLASAATAAATFNGYSADSCVGADGALASAAASTMVNKGLFLSNLTGAFTTGDSTLKVHVTYSTVTTTV